jgi:hypothetical protein
MADVRVLDFDAVTVAVGCCRCRWNAASQACKPVGLGPIAITVHAGSQANRRL